MNGLLTDIVSPQGHALHFTYESTETDLPGIAPYTIRPDEVLTVARLRRLTRIDERTFVMGEDDPVPRDRWITFVYDLDSLPSVSAVSAQPREPLALRGHRACEWAGARGADFAPKAR